MEHQAKAEAATRTRPGLDTWPAVVTAEAVVLLAVVAAVLSKLAMVEHSGWRAIFLANGDSLTLPLVLQSLHRGEPFHWVFSSQTFFFPDFPLYAICAALTGSTQGALVLNAVVNVLLLYVGIRVVVRACDRRSRTHRLAVSAAAIGLFLVAVLTETDVKVVGVGTVEPARIATEFLMTTYYSGTLLVALGMLALAFWASHRLDGSPLSTRRVVVAGSVAAVVGSAAMFSNPLYLLWFVAPLGLASLILLVCRRISLRVLLVVITPQVLALGGGTLARAIYPQFIAADYAHYLATYGAAESAAMLGGVVAEWASSPWGVIRGVVVLAPLVFVAIRLGRGLAARRRGGRWGLETRELFLALFIVISATSLIVGVIVTGQSVTRYLVPLFVFPPLGLLLLRPRPRPSREVGESPATTVDRRRGRLAALALLAVASLVAIGLSSSSVAALASPRAPVDAACLDGWLGHQSGGSQLNGAGDFWSVRALTVYGAHSGALVQMDAPTLVHAWMNNLWLYEHRTFSYVVADDVLGGETITAALGQPADVVTCTGYAIYDYRGTPGESLLTEGLRSSFATVALTHRY